MAHTERHPPKEIGRARPNFNNYFRLNTPVRSYCGRYAPKVWGKNEFLKSDKKEADKAKMKRSPEMITNDLFLVHFHSFENSL